jgi:hypothetical protein
MIAEQLFDFLQIRTPLRQVKQLVDPPLPLVRLD